MLSWFAAQLDSVESESNVIALWIAMIAAIAGVVIAWMNNRRGRQSVEEGREVARQLHSDHSGVLRALTSLHDDIRDLRQEVHLVREELRAHVRGDDRRRENLGRSPDRRHGSTRDQE